VNVARPKTRGKEGIQMKNEGAAGSNGGMEGRLRIISAIFDVWRRGELWGAKGDRKEYR